MKRTPLRRCSKKHAIALKQYAVLRKEYLADHPFCQATLNIFDALCMEASSQIHHVNKRGKYLNDTSTWKSVCRDCHKLIHDNPKLAREHGLLK